MADVEDYSTQNLFLAKPDNHNKWAGLSHNQFQIPSTTR